jgi:cellulose synthase/poly-beta-1,6-N-acetylglucosamine synthase-like glycosyltransferase
MKAILNVIMVLLSMIALILEKSSCFEILVVGLLFMILFELEKFKLKK